jgi:hypothetical protein
MIHLSPNLSSSDGHLYMGGLDERLIESRIAENIRQTQRALLHYKHQSLMNDVDSSVLY